MIKYEIPKVNFIKVKYDDIITTSVGIDLPSVDFREQNENKFNSKAKAFPETGSASNDRLESTFPIIEKTEK